MAKPISPPSRPIPLAPQITSTDLVGLWLRQQESEHTRRAYERDIRRLLRFAAKPLDRLTALDLARFADHLLGSGLAPISRARTLTAVRSLLRFGYRSGVLAMDLPDKVQVPRYDRALTQRILEEDLVRKMIDLEEELGISSEATTSARKPMALTTGRSGFGEK